MSEEPHARIPPAREAGGRAARLIAPLLIGIAVLAVWEGAGAPGEVALRPAGPVQILDPWRRLADPFLPRPQHLKTAVGAFLLARSAGSASHPVRALALLEASLFLTR